MKAWPLHFSHLPGRRSGKRLWFLRLYVVSAFLTGILYLTPFMPPDKVWLAGFAVFAIPVALLFHSVAAILLLFVRPSWVLLPLMVMGLGFRHIQATFQWHEQEAADDFTVLSMNVETFRGYARHTPERILMAHEMLRYLTKSDADILCLQEFYERPKSHIYNTVTRFKKSGYKYHYYSRALNLDKQSTIGVAIFSKWPIVGHGTVYHAQTNNNQIIFADVITPEGVVRVYSLHLESIRLRPYEIQDNSTREEVKRNLKTVTRKLRNGFERRGAQFDILLKHLKQSPWPVIIAGDFNEVPYSYIYQQLKGRYQNAFEEKGQGFGITFNGFLPFLRIDNQWADPKLKISHFRTAQEVKASDHFPLEVGYQMRYDVQPK